MIHRGFFEYSFYLFFLPSVSDYDTFAQRRAHVRRTFHSHVPADVSDTRANSRVALTDRTRGRIGVGNGGVGARRR